jgi:hypothetical protein
LCGSRGHRRNPYDVVEFVAVRRLAAGRPCRRLRGRFDSGDIFTTCRVAQPGGHDSNCATLVCRVTRKHLNGYCVPGFLAGFLAGRRLAAWWYRARLSAGTSREHGLVSSSSCTEAPRGPAQVAHGRLVDQVSLRFPLLTISERARRRRGAIFFHRSSRR